MKKLFLLGSFLLVLAGCGQKTQPTTEKPVEEVKKEVPAKEEIKNEKETKNSKEELIPSSRPGDKGKYYLLKKAKNGDTIVALHKRVGVDVVGYTKTETNCKTMKMREIGYSEESPEAIKENPTKWFDLVEGSSKSDLANFVCKK